ncbi:MAG: type IV toxin-antitoxin system AbiEi family antitoxin domain-containing protein [Desulfomonilia bacterium]|jgi:predicted transcriptional regulator of viral defense system|nr:type IV toxin-antitoxin system AbiEi family antitoxin domain-containing protein [Deltaproteobacteria bacterium]MDI9543272.1 transcriptional regulator [Pseudomonadota bacterium]HPX50050.1 transcriptional regulator [Deltaproteobacteria bacterium]
MKNNDIEKVLNLIRRNGVIRPRDPHSLSIPRTYLQRLLQKNSIIRIDRVLYTLPDMQATEHHTFAEAAKRVPQRVLCLLSTLSFHGLNLHTTHEVWMIIDKKAKLPMIDYPSLKFVRFSGDALEKGIEHHDIERAEVRVYSPAKTVADCFKFRNKIGIDVALEALRDIICRYSRICRVEKVMKPCLEALL